MGRYILVRTGWIFIILFTILSLNFVLLKIAPDFPPTTKEEQGIYFARQVSDGYMTRRIIDDKETIDGIKEGTIELPKGSFFIEEGETLAVYDAVPIAVQYVSWVKNVITDWNWGLSTRVEVGRPVFEVLSSRMVTTLQ